jgi:hypothetical protein
MQLYNFEVLTDVMMLCLDNCLEVNDVVCAKNLGMMANTFYRQIQNPDDSKGTKLESEDSETAAFTHQDRCHREYITEHLKDHEIWHEMKFWEDNLMSSVSEQLILFPQAVCCPFETLSFFIRGGGGVVSFGWKSIILIY